MVMARKTVQLAISRLLFDLTDELVTMNLGAVVIMGGTVVSSRHAESLERTWKVEETFKGDMSSPVRSRRLQIYVESSRLVNMA